MSMLLRVETASANSKMARQGVNSFFFFLLLFFFHFQQSESRFSSFFLFICGFLFLRFE